MRSLLAPLLLAGPGRRELEPDVVRGVWSHAPGPCERVDDYEPAPVWLARWRLLRVGRWAFERDARGRELDTHGAGQRRDCDIDARASIGVRVLDAVRRDLADEQPQRVEQRLVERAVEPLGHAAACRAGRGGASLDGEGERALWPGWHLTRGALGRRCAGAPRVDDGPTRAFTGIGGALAQPDAQVRFL